ncbi:MAG: DUF4364 family protein [Ruminococcus sp.]|jgi:hypothetical protein|uniref:DUF4364 family protein n=1 Tax=Schaedlerella arabinosiphila TaxID=2044587 RepID=N2AKV0_9FIRM|nr:DUF4364 family protein [Schaedlerella arabinosiphila]MCI8723509.1 DUF4364 family protein [Ruminococcus sp.]KAI4444340.1 hypothetical protein C824_000769 [Schaedlerella arabinosiphila]MCI9212934.1 DUF4364 family protein [Ruminococcus sp.]MCI9603334.1 DUF4364 family protein [Ruminococcus sp.]NDO70796.1 DUF4364 family protein [Schaedlerella arabinosiphila]
MNETLTLYKLMILYLLKKVDFPLATTQISDFMLGMEYTNYFRLQEALSELQEANLVEAENTYRRTLYHLTGDGVRTIRLLQGNINFEIRRDIDAFVKENEFHLREALSAKASYYLNANQEYEARCQILEGKYSLLDLKLTVPTRAEAEAISKNWNAASQEIYGDLLTKLL